MKRPAMLKSGGVAAIFTMLIVGPSTSIHSEPLKATADTVDTGEKISPNLARPCHDEDFKPEAKFVVLSEGPEKVAAANMLRYRVSSDYGVQLGVWVTDGKVLKKGQQVRIMEERCPDSNVTDYENGPLVVK